MRLRCSFRMVAMAAAVAAAVAVSPAIAAAQAVPPPHDHGSKAGLAAPVGEPAARLARLDARIAMLTADMKMFVGEMKIQTMEMLIEALVERQTLSDVEMRRMREHMGGPMNDLRKHAPKWIEPELELQPDTLCSPFV